MEFKYDVFSLSPSKNRKFLLEGAKLPTSTDLYFRAKQDEIIDQYAAARLFLRETETDDWRHWFEKPDNDLHNRAFELIFSSYFYETALTYYNVLIDLSWTICYVSAEYACELNGKSVPFSGVKPIEEAYSLLRQAEKVVSHPTSENNPFQYLKVMCPEYEEVIDLIIEFWKDFSNTNIRKNYNFFKHKGKPAYLEIEKLKGGRLMGIYIKDANNQDVQIASDICDVKYKISLMESINELKEFDDEKLFPYLKRLLELLENLVSPSPMVF